MNPHEGPRPPTLAAYMARLLPTADATPREEAKWTCACGHGLALHQRRTYEVTSDHAACSLCECDDYGPGGSDPVTEG